MSLDVVLVEEDAALAVDVPLGIDPPLDAVDHALVEGDGLLLGPSSSARRTMPITIPTSTTNGNAIRAITQPRLEGGLPAAMAERR